MKHKLFDQRKIIIVVGLISCIFLLNFWGGEKVKEDFFWVSSPLLHIGHRSGNYLTHQFQTVFTNRQSLEQENQDLHQQINQLFFLQGTNQQLVEENSLLRKALSIKEKEGLNTYPAQLIAQNLSQDWLLINQGEKEGITLNQPVITFEKALVGKIIAVYPHSSKVRLISHSQSVIEAEILQNQKPPIQGLARGEEGGRLNLELIPLDSELQNGEVIIVSSLNADYPAGLPVGTIQTIKKENTKLFQKAEILPFFRQQNIQHLLIITQF